VSQEHDFRDKQYFYKFLEPQKKVEINERFKIVILGPANSGKSSLFRLLPLKTLKKSSAKGKAVAPEIIQRAGWKSTISQAVYANPGLSNDAIGRRQSSATNLSPVDNIEENILFTLWDFARDPELDTDPNVSTCSQIIHRLFLTSSRTLYLLCVDLSKFNAIEVDSHIQIIHTYAPHAPILLVGTHQDEVSSQRISQVESFIKSRYKKYKALKELSTVSCTSLKNISKLKNLIVSIKSIPLVSCNRLMNNWCRFQLHTLAFLDQLELLSKTS
jgi:GTPase SAR1 family protein